jgi:hypothetical protein
MTKTEIINFVSKYDPNFIQSEGGSAFSIDTSVSKIQLLQNLDKNIKVVDIDSCRKSTSPESSRIKSVYKIFGDSMYVKPFFSWKNSDSTLLYYSKNSIKYLTIDLRHNQGGPLTQIQTFGSLFFPKNSKILSLPRDRIQSDTIAATGEISKNIELFICTDSATHFGGTIIADLLKESPNIRYFKKNYTFEPTIYSSIPIDTGHFAVVPNGDVKVIYTNNQISSHLIKSYPPCE